MGSRSQRFNQRALFEWQVAFHMDRVDARGLRCIQPELPVSQ
jgi:hypothetical protein